MGCNCQINSGVVIGLNKTPDNRPIIGNNVLLSPGVKITGKCKIGSPTPSYSGIFPIIASAAVFPLRSSKDAAIVPNRFHEIHETDKTSRHTLCLDPVGRSIGRRRLDNQHPIFISGRLWRREIRTKHHQFHRFAAAIRVFPVRQSIVGIE